MGGERRTRSNCGIMEFAPRLLIVLREEFARCHQGASPSAFFDKTVHHHLVASLVEGNGKLVVFDALYGTVAELLMEDAIPAAETADAAHLLPANRHSAPFDQRRLEA